MVAKKYIDVEKLWKSFRGCSVTTIFHYFFFCVIITVLYDIIAILLTSCNSLHGAFVLLVLPPIINDLRVVDVIDVIFL